jgi:hypothetical protein
LTSSSRSSPSPTVSIPIQIFETAKKIFLVGPPGSNRKENALALAEYFNWACISIGDLLKKEVSKKSEFGKAITESLHTYRYGKIAGLNA